jgi:hypothetical protein
MPKTRACIRVQSPTPGNFLTYMVGIGTYLFQRRYIIYGEGTTLFISLDDAWDVLQKYEKKKSGNYVHSITLAGKEVWDNKNDYGLDGILTANEESPFPN